MQPRGNFEHTQGLHSENMQRTLTSVHRRAIAIFLCMALLRHLKTAKTELSMYPDVFVVRVWKADIWGCRVVFVGEAAADCGTVHNSWPHPECVLGFGGWWIIEWCLVVTLNAKCQRATQLQLSWMRWRHEAVCCLLATVFGSVVSWDITSTPTS